MEKEFEILEHTADVGIIAYGNAVNEAFANAAKGMFSLITELDKVRDNEHRDIEITAPDQENLLINWLNELNFIFDTENILFKKFEIYEISETGLKARAYGEKADNKKHELKTGIKAATYHMLKIEEDNGINIQVLFDI